jgi:uncharacterized protein YdbL (DUF1318 family)
MKEVHKELKDYYEKKIIGEALTGEVKIVNPKKVKEEDELVKLKKLVKEINSLREEFYKEFAKEEGKDSEEAIAQVKKSFINKVISRAREAGWCVEEKDEEGKIQWNCSEEK